MGNKGSKKCCSKSKKQKSQTNTSETASPRPRDNSTNTGCAASPAEEALHHGYDQSEVRSATFFFAHL